MPAWNLSASSSSVADITTSNQTDRNSGHDDSDPLPRKRKRLTHACNRCRSKKIRCDERHPDCSNCAVAKVRCITQDPRQPTAIVRRQEAQKRVESPQNSQSPSISEASRSTSYLLDSEASPTAFAQESQSLNSRIHVSKPTINQVPELESDNISHERAVVSGLPAIPRFAGSNSVYILSQWLDLAFARIGHPQRFYRQYKESQARIEAMHCNSPSTSIEEILQKFHDHDFLIGRFLSTINMVFPIFGSTVTKTDFRLPQMLCIATTGTRPEFDSTIYCLVLGAGSIGLVQDGNDLPSRCLNYVSANLGTLVTATSLEVVNILALSAIISRGCNKSGLAWSFLGLGISMALTLGLNRSSTTRPAETISKLEKQSRRIWLVLYILDRTLSIELERPGIIRDYDCNFNIPATVYDSTNESDASCQDKGRALQAIFELARLQGQVNEKLLISRHTQETGRLSHEELIKLKMREAGELDQMLLEWSEHLPHDLRPSEHSFCDPLISPAVLFMATQFYQTLFLIHRNALIVNAKGTQKTLDVHFIQAPYRLRLLNGQNICCAAARSIVKIMNDVHETGHPSALTPIHAPLVALCALSVQILRTPQSGFTRADLELQASAIALILRENSRSNTVQDTGLETFMRSLHSEVSAHVNGTVRPGSIEKIMHNEELAHAQNWPQENRQQLSKNDLILQAPDMNA